MYDFEMKKQNVSDKTAHVGIQFLRTVSLQGLLCLHHYMNLKGTVFI